MSPCFCHVTAQVSKCSCHYTDNEIKAVYSYGIVLWHSVPLIIIFNNKYYYSSIFEISNIRKYSFINSMVGNTGMSSVS